MSEPALKRVLATIEDLAAIPEERRNHEILDGELVERAMPTFKHGRAQRRLSAWVDPFERRSRGPHDPGGWWFATEVEVSFAPHQVVRPDVGGWRRERVGVMPDEWPISVRPDWVAEVLSRSTARNDLLLKLDIYHQYEVPHYWILDPESGVLRVHRWRPEGYHVVLSARRGARVRAEPFELLELSVDSLLGEDEE